MRLVYSLRHSKQRQPLLLFQLLTLFYLWIVCRPRLTLCRRHNFPHHAIIVPSHKPRFHCINSSWLRVIVRNRVPFTQGAGDVPHGHSDADKTVFFGVAGFALQANIAVATVFFLSANGHSCLRKRVFWSAFGWRRHAVASLVKNRWVSASNSGQSLLIGSRLSGL